LWFLNPGFFCLLALQGSCVLCIRFFQEVQYLQHTRLVSSLTILSTGSCLISGVMAWWGLGSFAGLDLTWNIRSWWGVALLLFRLNALSTTPLVQHSCMAIVTLPWRLSMVACLTPKRLKGLIWAAFQCKFTLSWCLSVKAFVCPLELSMVDWMLSNYFNSPRILMSTLYSHKMHWAASLGKHNLCGYQLVPVYSSWTWILGSLYHLSSSWWYSLFGADVAGHEERPYCYSDCN
jgi:hypothetical protein